MKVYLFGQGSFGAAVLRRLATDGHQVAGVASAPQRQKLDRLSVEAIRLRLPYTDADRVRPEDVPEGTDLIVAAHSHHFISTKTRARARHGAIGYHPSALPVHRGRDAVRWTVLMRERLTAGTVYQLDEAVDGGPILSQRLQHVDPAWDYHQLWRAMFPVAVDQLCGCVNAVAKADTIHARPQDERLATWEPSFDRPRLFRPDLPRLA
jgi:methionyl-tRNA formyltransferase